VIGVLPNESSLNTWLLKRDSPNGEMSQKPGTLIVFWELNPKTGERAIESAVTKNTAWHHETNQ
jgi:hypothetical protein